MRTRTRRNPKDEFDSCVEYLNAAINRFHEGKVGLGSANLWVALQRLHTWEAGLLEHVYPTPPNTVSERQYEEWGRARGEAQDILSWKSRDDQPRIAADPKLFRAVGKEMAAKHEFAVTRSGVALEFWRAIDSNVQNAAGRSKQHFYREFQKQTDVFGKANAAKHGQGSLAAEVRDRQGKKHLEKLDVKLALTQAAQDADAWLESANPAAVFARKQIEKFKAGVRTTASGDISPVRSKFGDSVCTRCGGPGFIAAFAHVDGGICYECGGSGVGVHR